ncbi:hypothetical protein [Sinimarinibacterium flocculans]|uniref:hypothetical protein n=1 Tax=Sinimarinibacterium flocculans TaxID=985250 RepID=UPI0024933E3C|nr:hypothetical protein [Sinimarinibacterium flocculans]
MKESSSRAGTHGVQAAIEAVMHDLLALPEVAEAKRKVRDQYFLPRSRGRTERDLAFIDHAIDEMAVHAAGAVAADPAYPRLTWYEFMPHETEGRSIGGGRYGFDNPDRVFRHFMINPEWQYEVRGRFNPDGSAPFYVLMESCQPKPPGWGYPLAFLYMDDIEPDAEGNFRITIDSTPTNGRKNHLHLPKESGHVLIRDTLVDWNAQMPAPMTVRRIGGPEVPPKSFETMRAQIAQEIEANAQNAFLWYDYALAKVEDNTISLPQIRPAPEGQTPWGMTTTARFRVAEDEALVFTLDRASARYLGIMVAEPWMVSIDYTKHTSCLNHSEVWIHPDDTVTYVIARRDPGVQNWLDAAYVESGVVLVRWELLQRTPDPATVVRDVRLVKLGDLAAVVPAQMPRVTPEMRRRQLETRAAGYARRVNAVLSATV